MGAQLSRVPKTIWIMIALYVVIFGLFTSFRHYNFFTQTWDMGVFIQIFWNTIEGRPMQNNIEDAPHHFGVHMSPWLFVLVPGYFLFQSPYYLLIAQTLALALGAWPLYLIAKDRLGKKWAHVISGAYLLYPGLHWINTFDFHEHPFLVPLLFASFYFLEKKRYGWLAFFLMLSASTREDSTLVVLFFGLFILIREEKLRPLVTKERLVGTSVAILALGYFILSATVFMPYFGGGLLRLDRYEALGGSVAEIIRTTLTEPSKVIAIMFTGPKVLYLLWLFLPTMFLPLLSWRTFILLIPGLFGRCYSSVFGRRMLGE